MKYTSITVILILFIDRIIFSSSLCSIKSISTAVESTDRVAGKPLNYNLILTLGLEVVISFILGL
jgi:hypothetical protein